MACCPLIDLADPFLDDGPTQILPQLHRPQPENRVRSSTRGGASEIAAALLKGFDELCDEIAGKEWRIGCDAGDNGAVRTVRHRPIEAGQNARERAGEVGNAVSDHREAKFREAVGIAVGVEHERIDLRPQPLDDALEQRNTAQPAQGFVTTAHAPRLTAGK
jgi:hypothetical protein